MSQDFTPALGHAALTPLYDAAIALLTREGQWRRALVAQIAPCASDRILDVGCGTGSLALMLKRKAPESLVIGLDPDPDVLRRAKRKTANSGINVTFTQGFARDAGHVLPAGATKAISSLVFHQVPSGEKRAGLAAMHASLVTGGEVHIADYGLQRTPLMRVLFKQIQRLDGAENTTPNAQGILPVLMTEVGFTDVRELSVIPTPTGSISLYFGRKSR